MHSKFLREFPAMTYETSEYMYQQMVEFISASEKIGVGLKKQAAIFLFQFHPENFSPIFLFWLFFLPVQNEGIFSYLSYEILI